MPKEYSYKDISKHDSKDDCYVVYNYKVYDISSFIKKHPGGKDVLLEYAGKDITKAFDDANHSDDALEKMEKYYKGDIKEDERKKKGFFSKLFN